MNSALQKKLLQYAPEPPAAAWEAISNQLDEGLNGMLLNKFADYEATPPTGLWNKIEENLATVPKQQKTTRIFSLSKYAAAAAILVLALTTYFLLADNQPADSGNIITALPPSKTTTEPSQPVNDAPGTIEDGAADHNSIEVVTAVNAGNDPIQTANYYYNPRDKRKRTSMINNLEMEDISFANAFVPSEAKEKATVITSIPVDKYMVYSDGDGQAMRMSKKLFEFFNCVKEELICQQEKKQLQQKIAAYATTNDFTGVVELLRNLKENQ
ncbi:MAG: hypothetical protein H0U44_11445 [Flavisolibacter sp.]|nr:hypothetical protein [Flavisolibacter sp.]